MDLARSHGLRVPRVLEVRDDALVLERIHGPTMGRDMTRRPWRIGRHVRTLVRLHAELHAIPFEGATLLHFDLHPENVLVSPAGPVVIDWTNAHAVQPDSDVAMTWLILATAGGLPGRLVARLFTARVGRVAVRRGLPAARAFRLHDPYITGSERERVKSAAP
ncbi:MAG: phosphotransferase [Chloroflexota bacterium]|nr:phosphotransferase [Chloroflexota bacterium]